MQTFAVELSSCDKCSIAGKSNAWVLCGSVRETSYFTLTALKIVKINLHHRWALSWRIIYLYLLERSEDDAVRKCAVVCWMRLLTTFAVYSTCCTETAELQSHHPPQCSWWGSAFVQVSHLHSLKLTSRGRLVVVKRLLKCTGSSSLTRGGH